MQEGRARYGSLHARRDDTFGIQYGSGTAQGHLSQDTVTMGGYAVAGQTFAVCNQLSSGLIVDSLSGIMGLSWRALAYSRGESAFPELADRDRPGERTDE